MTKALRKRARARSRLYMENRSAIRLLGSLHERLWAENRRLGANIVWHAILHLVGEPPRHSYAERALYHFARVDEKRKEHTTEATR